MIDTNRALELIKHNLPLFESEKRAVNKSVGLSAAHDIHAPLDLPPFAQSSVDGYAIRFDDPEGLRLRIFTGHPVPAGFDTVLMQEFPQPEKKGLFVRAKGSHLKEGDLVLSKGERITSAMAGTLSGLGLSEIDVIRRPTVGILTTGNEVIQPGLPLSDGKVYDANMAMLSSLLTPIVAEHVPDDPHQILEAIERSLEKCDLLLITGGASVGDHDYVAAMLEKAGVTKIFHGVKQKPGKPLYFGKKESKLVFGLPGNPVSTLVCFHLYIASILGASPLCLQLPLASPFHKKAGLTHFLRGFIDGHQVAILPGQESYMLHTLAKANCLISIPEAVETVNKRELVDVRIF